MTLEIDMKDGEPKNRWVSYFDLLGFKRLVKDNGSQTVSNYLLSAIEESKKRTEPWQSLEAVWFSDTFVFYSMDDSDVAFREIESASRWFMYFLLTGGTGIPVRGAMSCGELYCDKENNVFFGKALIEAYEYGENQDWIGFALCPSAIIRMDELGIPAGARLNYRYWSVPRKSSCQGLADNLPCLIFHENFKINGKPTNPFFEKLKTLKEGVGKEITVKYENAIRFIEKNQRSLPGDL